MNASLRPRSWWPDHRLKRRPAHKMRKVPDHALVLPLVRSPLPPGIWPRLKRCGRAGPGGCPDNLIKYKILADQLRTQANSFLLMRGQMAVQPLVHHAKNPDQA